MKRGIPVSSPGGQDSLGEKSLRPVADVCDCPGAAGAHHCGGHGGGRAAHVHGGCCAGHGAQDRALSKRPTGSSVRIAVTSQNRKTVTEHAGKCRKFWIFEVHGKEIVNKTLLELGIEQSLHAASGAEPHPLDAIEVLITAGAGAGLQQRLARMGTVAVVTAETDPDRAVAAYLADRG